jgi:hypothetical protein
MQQSATSHAARVHVASASVHVASWRVHANPHAPHTSRGAHTRRPHQDVHTRLPRRLPHQPTPAAHTSRHCVIYLVTPALCFRRAYQFSPGSVATWASGRSLLGRDGTYGGHSRGPYATSQLGAGPAFGCASSAMMALCHGVTLSQPHGVTVPQRRSVTVSRCHGVTVSRCWRCKAPVYGCACVGALIVMMIFNHVNIAAMHSRLDAHARAHIRRRTCAHSRT